MTQDQIRGVVAGFMHVLQTSPDVVSKWANVPKNDADEVGGFIAKTMGLASAPTHDDLKAMAEYADAQLLPKVEQMKASGELASTTVGYVYTQQMS